MVTALAFIGGAGIFVVVAYVVLERLADKMQNNGDNPFE